jgi:putative ubiquitin-RnfH superfamily antitoxin RatB of RatAB toxin-antitoxin module
MGDSSTGSGRKRHGEIHVQVCYARPDTQILVDLTVPAGTSLRQAIAQSGVLTRAPGIDLTVSRVGIFGKLKTPDTILRDGDRVEIYRPLTADPKESRRKRVEKKVDKKTR